MLVLRKIYQYKYLADLALCTLKND